MYTIQYSALETALLPYFLFIVYAAILLWVLSVRAAVEISPAAEQTDFVISVPTPDPDPLAVEFKGELLSRTVKPATRKRRTVSELIMAELEAQS
jgi:hypothetical protein